MSNPFAHPSSKKLLGCVADVFKKKKVFQRRDRHIIFVCGGVVRAWSRSMRNRFLKYSPNSLQQYRFFLAEAASKDLTHHSGPEFLNLVDFETLIAKISDCILLFLESAGSIGELGAFINSKTAVKKLLVVNDVNKQKDSFINVGLLDKVNTKSDFKAVILLNRNRPNFGLVEQRLTSRLSTKSGKNFEFKNFTQFTPQEQLYLVFQIIYIFKALKYESIVHCVKDIFKDANRKRIRHLLSVLIATEYIERKGDDLEYFAPTTRSEPFLDFRNYDVRDLQAIAAGFFKKYHKETYRLLAQVVS